MVKTAFVALGRANHNAVVDRAPLRGFLHPTQNMDTLGYDRGDRKCRI